ncbi:MAG: TMEM198/TM7SF3 family protein [Chloroflexi bacterium]|nr:TMEM198/TM7SF3 family protein [Chloroflexota bacterium]
MDIFRQLQVLSEQIGSFAGPIEPLIALIAIVAGGVTCFAGVRFAKAVLAMMGFIAGAALATVIGLLVTRGNTDALLIPIIVGGLVGMAVSLGIYFAGLILSGVLVGTFAAVWLGALANAGPNLLVVIALALLGGWVFVAAEKTALTLATALGGAWALVSGVSMLAGGGGLNVIAYLRDSPAAGFGATMLFAGWLAVSVVGAIVQFGKVPGLALKIPGEQLRRLLMAGGAVVTCGALFAIAFSAWALPPPAIPAPTKASVLAGTPRATSASGTPDASATALSATATAMTTPPPDQSATATSTAPTATRTPVPSPTRDPASYTFRADGLPVVDRSRRCIGGYYIYGIVRDRLGQPMSGARIKYGTATVFPPVAVTEAKGYELTVGSTDGEWYVRIVDDKDVEISPVVVVRTAGLDNGDCWVRLDWKKN